VVDGPADYVGVEVPVLEVPVLKARYSRRRTGYRQTLLGELDHSSEVLLP